MRKYINGYNTIDLTADDVYVQAKNIVDVQNKKPTFIFDGTNTTAIQTIVLNNDNTITINGELTIAINGTLTPSDWKISSGGGVKYLHTLYAYANYNCNNDNATFTFLSNDSTPITLSSLFDYLNTHRDIIIKTYGINVDNYSLYEYELGYNNDSEKVLWGDREIDNIENFVDIVSLNLDI